MKIKKIVYFVEKPKRGKKYWTCTFKRDGAKTWAGIYIRREDAEFRCKAIKSSQFSKESKSNFKFQKLKYPFKI